MDRIEFTIRTEKQFIRLNDKLNSFLKGKTGLGMVNVFVAHTTCAIKILEGEILLLGDINNCLNQMFPKDKNYLHDIIEIRDVPLNERVNGVSHMRQLFFDVSADIPVKDGEMMLGKWQGVYLVEFDPIRERKIIVTYID